MVMGGERLDGGGGCEWRGQRHGGQRGWGSAVGQAVVVIRKDGVEGEGWLVGGGKMK